MLLLWWPLQHRIKAKAELFLMLATAQQTSLPANAPVVIVLN